MRHFRPFSNGSEYCDWLDMNCCRCLKYHTDKAGEVVSPICPMEKALSKASVMGGEITTLMAERIGIVEVKGKAAAWKQLRPSCWQFQFRGKPPTAWDTRIGQARDGSKP